MKTQERKKAIELRQRGLSMGEIAKKLKVAKGSVSLWVRDVPLPSSLKLKLSANGHSLEAIEKRRVARVNNTNLRRTNIILAAQKEAALLSKDPLWCAGVALYWGEGGKTQQTVRLANSDPEAIQVMMLFFKKFSQVPFEKYHAHVHTFSSANAKKAVEYWSRITLIPQNKFYKTYIKQSSASKQKRKTLPYGTVQVYVHSSEFFFRMMGWLEGYKKHLL